MDVMQFCRDKSARDGIRFSFLVLKILGITQNMVAVFLSRHCKSGWPPLRSIHHSEHFDVVLGDVVGEPSFREVRGRWVGWISDAKETVRRPSDEGESFLQKLQSGFVKMVSTAAVKEVIYFSHDPFSVREAAEAVRHTDADSDRTTEAAKSRQPMKVKVLSRESKLRTGIACSGVQVGDEVCQRDKSGIALILHRTGSGIEVVGEALIEEDPYFDTEHDSSSVQRLLFDTLDLLAVTRRGNYRVHSVRNQLVNNLDQLYEAGLHARIKAIDSGHMDTTKPLLDGFVEVGSPQPPQSPALDSSKDPDVVLPVTFTALDEAKFEQPDMWTLTPLAALKMLSRSMYLLTSLTGDISPPPGRSRPQSPDRSTVSNAQQQFNRKENLILQRSRSVERHIDDVPSANKKTTSNLDPHESDCTHHVSPNAEQTCVELNKVARRFYNKRMPPITTQEYLLRMHKYCPMGTAVYLATSLYINRMTVGEPAISVTPRNVLRLLLAGLRVATKMLEDINWPHARFSKVGGVSGSELRMLEIRFCSLVHFDLRVDAEQLQAEVIRLAQPATTTTTKSLR